MVSAASQAAPASPQPLPPPALPRAVRAFANYLLLHAGLATTLAVAPALVQRRRPVPPSASAHLHIAKLLNSLHAAGIFAASVPLLYGKARPWARDWLRPFPDDLDRALARVIGFSAYDAVVLACCATKVHPSVWTHHVAAALGAAGTRWYKLASYLPASFLPTEITVVPTNILEHLDGLIPSTLSPSAAAIVYHVRTILLLVRCALFTVFRLPSTFLCLKGALDAERVMYAPLAPPSFPVVVAPSYLHCRPNLRRCHEEELHRNKEAAAAAANTAQPSETAPPSSRRSTPRVALSFLWRLLTATPAVVAAGSLNNMVLFGLLNSWWTVLVYRALFRHLRAPPRRGAAVGTGVHHI
ncbi:hypothetical protein HK405_015535 [Cladochytrium tenue]|nr:hypothetical protein HK405_015535 [Cladochytrium tenue]